MEDSKAPAEEDNRPSKTYMEYMLSGARENGLPQPYIKMLEEVEDNGHERDAKLDVPLDRQ